MPHRPDTGRFQESHPATYFLQRDGRWLRWPPEKESLASPFHIDYSGIELRVFAAMCGRRPNEGS
jgi:hypothetical protein